jgi:predicted outer membrane repeat protein
MKRQYFYLSFIFLILIFPALAVADGGMVIWPPPVHLDQTAQNAIVAWNGEEEIIILSNNIKSDSNATVLRMVPLPSNPTEIKEADPNCFEKLVELMNEKLKAIWPIPPGPVPPGPDPPPPGGIEIIFHEKIGAHDVTVVKVNNIDYFLNWIKNFAQDKGLQVKEISQTFKDGVTSYLKRRIEYFVFDVIEPEAGEESIKPLIYRFDCDCLYYSVLISGISEISESWAKINLFLITPEDAVLFDPPYSYYIHPWFYSYGLPVRFTEEELQEVSEDLLDLFEGPVKARKASLYEKLDQLTRDLSLYPCHFWDKDLTLGSSGEEVKALQKILINEGLWDSDQKVTGYFGQVTKDALTKFQEKYLGFSRGTGYFDRETREYFKKLSIKLWGQIIYVDADANGANDGSSWSHAYNCLQDALAAAYSGDEIRVAQGTYKPDQGAGITPGDPTATFQLKNGVTIKGGYAGFSEPDPNARDIGEYETILSGDLAGNDRYVNDPCDLLDDPCRAENSYHVVIGSGTDATTVLDGFTITGGNANGPGYPGYHIHDGGGMYIRFGSPTVNKCTFRVNTASRFGGGMYNEYGSPTVSDCTFRGNKADWNGGGMFNWYNNKNLVVSNSKFIGNSAGSLEYVDAYGGGMSNISANVKITNCIFSGNSAESRYGGDGGGIIFGLGCNALSLPITNCTFTGNRAKSNGGGICVVYEPCPGQTDRCVFNNCIIWGNRSFAGYSESAQIEMSGPSLVNYCCIQGWTGNLGGIGNIGDDPCFVQPGYWEPPLPPMPGQASNPNPADGATGVSVNVDLSWTAGVNTNWHVVWFGTSSLPPFVCTQTSTTFDPGTLAYSTTYYWRIAEMYEYGITIGDVWNFTTIMYPPPPTSLLTQDAFYMDGTQQRIWIEGDYHLLPGSPCIDSGDPNYTAEPNETDLDGRPRVIGGRIDMGAYEAPIFAEARIVPHALSLDSKGKWIAALLWLPEAYNITDIDPHSIFLEGQVQPERFRVAEDQQAAIAKFSREDVQVVLVVGEVKLTITGRLNDGSLFEAKDTIKVIDKGGKEKKAAIKSGK